MEFTFGEQINIILKRKNMSIQDLANLYESKTGVKMTRQNLSQRLKRDNFQEQDMHTIAGLLGYQISIQLNPLETPALPCAPAISKKSLPANRQVTTADGSTLKVPNRFCKPQVQGEVNPMTGEEYLTNTVRQHPTLPNYLQVYDRATHEWNDVNEDYFWKFQANKKELLGSDYQEPIMI